MDNRLKKSFEKLAELAKESIKERRRFDILNENYYGFTYGDCEFSIDEECPQASFCDDDEIIDTLDYGTNDIQFEEYDRRMMKAKRIIESHLSG